MLKHIATITLFLLGIAPAIQAQKPTIPDAVKENIKARVDNEINTGIVVGVITPKGTKFYSYGVKSLETKEAVDENSVFEIGSISKTFTGILLADMVEKGDLKLDDPLQSLLPEGVTAPTRNGETIKLYQMSNHTSGLPRMPTNFTPADPANPYVDYSEKQLYEFLNGYKLTRDIGSQYEYSNYAVGLLGHLMAAKRHKSYEELMVEVIANPLSMKNTRLTLSPEMKKNLAMGHSNGRQVSNWDLTTLAGAGGIRSTAVDMLKYLAANMGLTKSPLYPAMQMAHKNSRVEGEKPIVGLGWHKRLFDDSEVVWHNGGTGGYRTFAGFIKGGNLGVVVLSNSDAGVDDIGIHLLHPASELANPKPSINVELKKTLEKDGIEAAVKTYWDLKKNHADEYDFSEEQLNTLGYTYLANEEIEKALAIFKLNIEAYPDAFNVYDSYGEALMNNNENEKAIANYKKSIELNPANTNGIEMLKKLGVNTDDLEKNVVVDDAILQTYVGKYELAPGFILTVAKYDSQLKAQATGQGEFPIFPSAENMFYYKVVQAQLSFNKNAAGEIESVTLFQNGQEIIGKKLTE